ncbi:DUF3368 domain-containing protein [Halococcoides cellulosivorans]|uniref:DUF3368 domain-containing protein n=1 Tax=Halococcoides cellulosivorans TaxID=1679096 RepID=A0A2R4X039_9EURY|nr:DUF3368 domain-containing protein [Halococcoides cellulosivorans]AWB27131.1 DUF3368 domain-containing protein [Halococcoides cellulosivorans]
MSTSSHYSSPLLNLALIERLDCLTRQFGTITIPQPVWAELTAGEDGLREIQAFRRSDDVTVVPVDRSSLVRELTTRLDSGEAAAIAHALDIDADRVLIDEREGRRVARRHDLDVTGAIGILIRAAVDGPVADLQGELDALRDAGFWISDDLFERALRDARTD